MKGPKGKRGPTTWSDTKRWAVASITLAVCLVIVVWLVVTDAPLVRFLVRLYQDKHFLKETVRAWGVMAPAVFVAIQALNLVRIVSLFYLGQWNFQWFEWAHLYVWQALIMLDALIVWLLWIRALPAQAPAPPPQPA